MQPDAKDMARLWDMLDASRAIASFIEGRSFTEFQANRMVRNAVERNLEIIGEAARSISQHTRDGYPDIPWSSIIGLRNIIAHEYGELRSEKIWGICVNRLPELCAQLEGMGIDEMP